MFRLPPTLFLLGTLIASTLNAQINLTSSVIGLSEEGAIHRVWLSVPSGSSVQSVYADGSNPMIIQAPAGAHQADGQALLSGSSAMDAVDSWFTVGTPSGMNVVNSTGGAQWNSAVMNFASGGDFLCEDDFGGAFFLMPSSSQGQESSGQVLLAQIVSGDSVTVQLNAQWKSAPGEPSQYAEGLAITLMPPAGCTDPTASNYDADALVDDGSCAWPTGGFEGLVYELSAPATVESPPTYRIYAELSNPNESVVSWYGTASSPISVTSTGDFLQMDGGSASHPGAMAGDLYERDSWLCLGDAPGAYFVGLDLTGFESGGALSSDSVFGGAVGLLPGVGDSGPDDDGRVLLAQLTTPGEIQFAANVKIQLEGGGTSDFDNLSLTIPAIGPGGCVDAVACNFDSESAFDDGSCLYDDALGVCGGDCLSDVDEDGICDDDEIPGCTDAAAPNYLPQATDDDGSCLSDDDPMEPIEGFVGLVQEATPASSDDLMVHRVYAQFDTAGYEVLAMFGTQGYPLSFTSYAGFHQDDAAGPLATDLPATGAAPTDSWMTIGGDGPGTVALYTIGMDFTSFESGGDLVVDASEGGALFVIPGTQPAAVSGPDGRVLLAQVASQGMVDVQLNLKVETPSGDAPEILGLELVVPPFVPGCADSIACNFNPSATLDDGSCLYVDGICQTCENGAVVDNDSDGDGICDAEEEQGCTDPMACNYDADPTTDTNDALCVFPAGCESCSGETNGSGTVVDNDADNDGVCDADEIVGCTDPMACNYDATSTTDSDNTLCVYATGCDSCSGETDGTGTVVDNDADEDGICNDDETEGCTDSTACNYNDAPGMDSDNAQCVYAGNCEVCSGPTDGTGVVLDVTDGLEGCTYPQACNYNPEACHEDGSCEFAAPGRDCAGNCLWDFNGDGTCDEPGTGGCTYPTALNYDPAAPYDDGTCEFATGNCAFDNNGDGEVDVIDLLDMLVALGTYCE